MNPYVDIHTHQEVLSNKNSISIFSFNPVKNMTFNQNVFFSAAVHPWSVQIENIDWYMCIVRKIAKHQHCLAIGECGLDYLHQVEKSKQHEIFIRHFEISEEFQLPLIIHCVKAWNDIIVLRKKLKPSMPWIIHGFNKSIETANQCLNAGFYLSLGKKATNNRFSQVLKTIPVDRMFLETDETNDLISDIYSTVYQTLGIDYEVFAEQIYQNFNTCFKKFRAS